MLEYKRFVYMSSCSVYGVADRDFVDEGSSVKPGKTAYAECQDPWSERDVQALARRQLFANLLRNATAYGASPRCDLDIVLNNLAGLAWDDQTDSVDQRRDAVARWFTGWNICRAIISVLEAPREAVC